MHIEHSDFHDQLMRGLAHKMNNILSLFHGYLGLLTQDKKLDHETKDGLARIREGADAASLLMDRARAFAKPTSTVWREVDLEVILRQMRPALEAFAERGVTLNIKCAEDLPRLWMDVARLRTAIFELVRNACEASPDDEIVTIEAYREANAGPQGRGWVTVKVSDRGRGIEPRLAKKIFQPFFSTKSLPNSMGLGLCVAMGFAQQLGGSIRFSCKNGKTVFRLLVPSHHSPG